MCVFITNGARATFCSLNTQLLCGALIEQRCRFLRFYALALACGRQFVVAGRLILSSSRRAQPTTTHRPPPAMTATSAPQSTSVCAVVGVGRRHVSNKARWNLLHIANLCDVIVDTASNTQRSANRAATTKKKSAPRNTQRDAF